MRIPCLARPTLLSLTLLLALPAAVAPRAAARDRLVQSGDAFVDRHDDFDEWTIGNASIRYTIGKTRDGRFRTAGLSLSSAAAPLTTSSEGDGLLTTDGELLSFGGSAGGFLVEHVSVASAPHFVSLAVRLRSEQRGLVLTRHYVVFATAAVVELWTSVDSGDGRTHRVENLNSFHLALPAGTVHYVAGLDTADEDGGPFARRSRVLTDGERVQLGSPTLSTQETMPYFSVAGGAGRPTLLAGLVWSGAWSVTLERQGDRMLATAGLPPMSATVRAGQPLEGPHAFIGASSDTPGADVAVLSQFVREGRGHAPLPALTTYNTWFVHGINIDEDVIRRDIDAAADIGIELFQLDAGWYPRERPAHVFDFSDGLGSWTADRERFPSGLAPLGDYARARGMKFGVWVEPERVALSTVGQDGLAERAFLAEQQGSLQPGVANEDARDGQVCLAHRPARDWVQRKLFDFLDQVRPDSIKWDVNRWLHCTRADHDHPVDGGNFAHTQALYEMLAATRARYPHLTIENCSQGGHRLDFAMARLTDWGWMDDRSAPSAHVRGNLHGLLQLFPASYLLSYAMAHPDEPMRGSPDLPLLVRSRMPGIVGVAANLGQLEERELNELHQQLMLAKRLRPAQQEAMTYPLTPQRGGSQGWEVIQQVLPSTGVSYFFAYTDRSTPTIRVQPRGLRVDTVYELRSADRGVIGTHRGADLVSGGLDIQDAPESAAQVLVLQPTSQAARK